jgi:hypothetical protein
MRASFVLKAWTAFLASFAVAPSLVQAQTTIDFEDLNPGHYVEAPVPAGYGGFTWQNLSYVADPPKLTAPSVYAGVIGKVGVVPTSFDASPIAVSRAAPFTFEGVCITAATVKYQQVVVEEWLAGAMIYTETDPVFSSGPLCLTFNPLVVDQVLIVPSSGPVVLDDFQYSAAPVPASTPPTITLGPVTPVVAAGNLTITGTATEGSGAQVALSGVVQSGTYSATFSVGPTGSFSVVVPVVNGPNSILFQVTDAAGNTASSTLSVVGDGLPPSIEVLSPAYGAVITTPVYTFSAQVTDASAVTVRVDFFDAAGNPLGGALAPVSSGIASLSWPITDGQFTVQFTATDAFNHSSSVSRSFIGDLSGPAVTVDVASGSRFGPLPGDLLTFHVTIADPAPTTISAP